MFIIISSQLFEFYVHTITYNQCMKWPVAHSPNSAWFWLELIGNCGERLKIIMKYTNIQFCERLGHGWQFHPLYNWRLRYEAIISYDPLDAGDIITQIISAQTLNNLIAVNNQKFIRTQVMSMLNAERLVGCLDQYTAPKYNKPPAPPHIKGGECSPQMLSNLNSLGPHASCRAKPQVVCLLMAGILNVCVVSISTREVLASTSKLADSYYHQNQLFFSNIVNSMRSGCLR